MATVLITGGSKGIGFELAKLFSQDDHSVVLVARTAKDLASAKKHLQSLGNGSVHTMSLDLAQPNAVKQAVSYLKKHTLTLDVLINNAGFGDTGPFHASKHQKQRDMIEVNCGALVGLTHAVLQDMIKRRRGQIVNIASIASFTPGPGMSVYFATKAFVLSFSQALAQELSGTGVRATTICPGRVATHFAQSAKMSDPTAFNSSAMPVTEAAHRAYQAIQRKERLRVLGVTNSIITTALKILPLWLTTRVMARANAYR